MLRWDINRVTPYSSTGEEITVVWTAKVKSTAPCGSNITNKAQATAKEQNPGHTHGNEFLNWNNSNTVSTSVTCTTASANVLAEQDAPVCSATLTDPLRNLNKFDGGRVPLQGRVLNAPLGSTLRTSWVVVEPVRLPPVVSSTTQINSTPFAFEIPIEWPVVAGRIKIRAYADLIDPSGVELFECSTAGTFLRFPDLPVGVIRSRRPSSAPTRVPTRVPSATSTPTPQCRRTLLGICLPI
jgi:hypothetical protein